MPSSAHFTEQSFHTEPPSDQRGKTHGDNVLWLFGASNYTAESGQADSGFAPEAQDGNSWFPALQITRFGAVPVAGMQGKGTLSLAAAPRGAAVTLSSLEEAPWSSRVSIRVSLSLPPSQGISQCSCCGIGAELGSVPCSNPA